MDGQKIDILGVQVGLTDRPDFEACLKRMAKHPKEQHPQLDFFSPKLKHISKATKYQDPIKKACIEHADVVRASTGIPLQDLNPVYEDEIRTLLLSKVKGATGKPLLLDLEQHSSYETTGRFYAICTKDNRDTAIKALSAFLASDGFSKAYYFQNTQSSVITRTPRPPKDTSWDDYSCSSRSFKSLGNDEDSLASAENIHATWAERIKLWNNSSGQAPVTAVSVPATPSNATGVTSEVTADTKDKKIEQLEKALQQEQLTRQQELESMKQQHEAKLAEMEATSVAQQKAVEDRHNELLKMMQTLQLTVQQVTPSNPPPSRLPDSGGVQQDYTSPTRISQQQQYQQHQQQLLQDPDFQQGYYGSAGKRPPPVDPRAAEATPTKHQDKRHQAFEDNAVPQYGFPAYSPQHQFPVQQLFQQQTHAPQQPQVQQHQQYAHLQQQQGMPTPQYPQPPPPSQAQWPPGGRGS